MGLHGILWDFLGLYKTEWMNEWKVRFSRTLVRNRTFWSKLVRKRFDFALKSSNLKVWDSINWSLVQCCFQTVVQLSESMHIPPSKLILTGLNTNYMAPSRGAQLCLNLVLGQYQAMVWFLSIFVTFRSNFGLISMKIMVWFRSDFGQQWSYFICGNTALLSWICFLSPVYSL